MKHVAQIMIGCLALAAVAAASQPSGSPQQTQPQAAPQKPHPANTGRGEEVFHQKTVFSLPSGAGRIFAKYIRDDCDAHARAGGA